MHYKQLECGCSGTCKGHPVDVPAAADGTAGQVGEGAPGGRAPIGTGGGPYPGFEKDLARHNKRAGGLAGAHARPLPGPLAAAFAEEPREVCGFELRPVVAAHMVFLQQIESPLLVATKVLMECANLPEEERQKRMLEEVEKERLARKETAGEAAARLDEETVETFFIFTRPPAEIRALLRKGRAAFRAEAMAAVMDRIPLTKLPEIRLAVGVHFASAFATAIEYEAQRPDDGTFTLPPARPMTG